jgi:hypothetical protein
MFLLAFNCSNACIHGLKTPREEIIFTALPKIHSHSKIFRYDRSIFCLPHQPNFSDIFDSCLYWVSVVRACIRSDKPSVKRQLKKYSVSKIVDLSLFEEIVLVNSKNWQGKSFSRSLKHFFLTASQNNFQNNVPFSLFFFLSQGHEDCFFVF